MRQNLAYILEILSPISVSKNIENIVKNISDIMLMFDCANSMLFMFWLAYSKNTNADITICSANSYNTQTKETTIMSWSLNEKFLPNKEIFNYKDVPDHIFNIAQNWNWNKIYKHEFIKKK